MRAPFAAVPPFAPEDRKAEQRTAMDPGTAIAGKARLNSQQSTSTSPLII